MTERNGQVVEIWRYPVKSMLGERLQEAQIGPDGITGDRAWSLVEPASGVSLTARRRPELLTARAHLDGDDQVVITLPDGNEASDDASLSAWLGVEVELRQASPDVTGTFESQADITETGEWFEWSGPAGSFHDSTRTKVSLVSANTLGSWDRRRFRINLITNGKNEESLVEGRLAIGPSLVLDVQKQIDRCVLVTRPQSASAGEAALTRNLDVLKTINSERDGLLGIGALVDSTGPVRVGDDIVVMNSAPPRPS